MKVAGNGERDIEQKRGSQCQWNILAQESEEEDPIVKTGNASQNPNSSVTVPVSSSHHAREHRHPKGVEIIRIK